MACTIASTGGVLAGLGCCGECPGLQIVVSGAVSSAGGIGGGDGGNANVCAREINAAPRICCILVGRLRTHLRPG